MVVTVLPHSIEVVGSIPGPFDVELACSSWVGMGSVWVQRLRPTVQKHAWRTN